MFNKQKRIYHINNTFAINKTGSGVEKRDQMHHRVYRKPDFPGSFEGADNKDRRVSPIQGMNVVTRSPSGGPIASSSTNTSSSSSSDIWVTTSDRTVTKSPRNAKSSGASTPMEDAVIGSLKTLIEPPKDGTLSRPGSAPTRGEDSLTDDILDPHQRSLSLPKSFLAHNTADRWVSVTVFFACSPSMEKEIEGYRNIPWQPISWSNGGSNFEAGGRRIDSP